MSRRGGWCPLGPRTRLGGGGRGCLLRSRQILPKLLSSGCARGADCSGWPVCANVEAESGEGQGLPEPQAPAHYGAAFPQHLPGPGSRGHEHPEAGREGEEPGRALLGSLGSHAGTRSACTRTPPTPVHTCAHSDTHRCECAQCAPLHALTQAHTHTCLHTLGAQGPVRVPRVVFGEGWRSFAGPWSLPGWVLPGWATERKPLCPGLCPGWGRGRVGRRPGWWVSGWVSKQLVTSHSLGGAARGGPWRGCAGSAPLPTHPVWSLEH